MIPLSTTWFYDATQGNLVLEIESDVVSGDLRSWPADVHSRSLGRGGYQILGPRCDGLQSQVSIFDSELVPGGNVAFSLSAFSPFNAFGGAMLGRRSGGFPLDLAPFGAPGCTLQFDPVFEQAATMTAGLHTSSGYVDWPIPPSSALVGFWIDHQVYMGNELEPPGAVVHPGAPHPHRVAAAGRAARDEHARGRIERAARRAAGRAARLHRALHDAVADPSPRPRDARQVARAGGAMLGDIGVPGSRPIQELERRFQLLELRR